MSVRQIHSVPCDVCERDTLHHVMVCSECGNIKATQSEQRRVAIARVFATRSRRLGQMGARELASIKRGHACWLSRQQKAELGRSEIKGKIKRPRSVNSERRPVKP